MLIAKRGEIVSGTGHTSISLVPVARLIAEAVGLPTLQIGTLDVNIGEHYPLIAIDGVIGPEQYNQRKQCVKLKRCRIRKAGSVASTIKAVIVRPSEHEDPRKPYWRRFEIMSHRPLKEALGVKDGDQVWIEIEGDHNEDPAWWDAPEMTYPPEMQAIRPPCHSKSSPAFTTICPG